MSQPRRFSLGRYAVSRGALREIHRCGDQTLRYFRRHALGDWGEVCAADATANETAIANEGIPDRQQRVLSVYRARSGSKLYVITEADRSITTLLLAEEY